MGALRFWALGLALSLVPSAVLSQERPPVSPQPIAVWYAAALGTGDRGFLITHFWSRGPLFRSETVIAGHRIVTLVNGEYYYMIDALGLTGLAVRRRPQAIAEDKTRNRPFGMEFEELIREGGEKIGTETAEGRTVDLYRITNNTGRRKVWVPQQPPFLPLRVETFHRASGRKDTIEYLNWANDLYPPDAFFAPHTDVRLRYLEFEEYVELSSTRPVGPAPVLFRELLYGTRQ